MLTTVHKPKMVQQPGDKPAKPLAIVEYNKNMGLVDKSDMQISFTDSTRQTIKWYKEFFFHLIDICVYNAYIVYTNTKGIELKLSDF